MKKIFYLFVLLTATVCFTNDLKAFNPVSPSSGTAITLSGDRNQTVTFTGDASFDFFVMDTVGTSDSFQRFTLSVLGNSTVDISYDQIKSWLINQGNYKVGDVVHCEWKIEKIVGLAGTYSANKLNITFTIGYFDDDVHLFNLLTPANNANVNFTQGPATQSLKFEWNKTFCKNGDVVNYRLMIDTGMVIDDNTNPYYAEVPTPTDTFYTMNYADVYAKIINYAHMNRPGSLKVYWNVIAENKTTGNIAAAYPASNALTINYVFGAGIKNNGFEGNVLCFPNPANTITNFSFNLKEKEKVRFTLYDMSGKKIRDMVYNNLPAGLNNIACSLDGISQGLYIWKLESETAEATGKINVSE